MKILIITMFLVIGYVGDLLANPVWAEKPVQCAHPDEVHERILADDAQLLMEMSGVARMNEQEWIDDVPYGVYYNPETEQWFVVEYVQLDEYACIIALGEGVNFDVDEYIGEEKKYY